MKSGKSMFWTAALSGMVGAGFGVAAGSNMVLVNMSVGVVIALLAAWGISGMLK